jgi:hypothetical protein
MNDLQHDNAKHALDFHRCIAAACVLLFRLHVQRPPPELFASDPQLYLTMVQNDGAMVCFQYLLHGGSPILRYQRVIRQGQGELLKVMAAYSIHVQRSLAFKTKSVLINFTSLMGLCCAHPKLQQVLHKVACVSIFGDFLMAMDRFLEYVNWSQQRRNTAFRGFDAQLHFTHFLKPLIQVDAAWREINGGGHGLDDGIPEYLFNDIMRLYTHFATLIPRDITITQKGNPFWFTGNAVPLADGDFRERTPWAYIWEVASGNSAGRGRKAAHWRLIATRFIAQCFPY